MRKVSKIINKSMESNLYSKNILSGKQLSKNIEMMLIKRMNKIKQLCDENNLLLDISDKKFISLPKLKIIHIGDRKDSQLYIDNKLKLCSKIGMLGEVVNFKTASKEELLKEIEISNNDKDIHGIIVQLPIPNSNIPVSEILSKISIEKDVDGLNPLNMGIMMQSSLNDCLIPPTAMGVLEMLRLCLCYNNEIDYYNADYLNSDAFYKNTPVNLEGFDITVLGRGLTAGLPLSLLLQKCNGTVTVCHSFSKDIKSNCKKADIIISAVGKADLISKEYIKQDAIIIDVGINVETQEYIKNDELIKKKKIKGDVNFDDVLPYCKFLTPVPGGVGLMTLVMLLKNVITAWSHINKIEINNI